MDADVIVVGAGLSGMVAALEAHRRGKRVIIVDQEGEQNLGGQAFWSFGGLFLVNSPEQRRLGIRDSAELAWSDWQGTAGWDRLDGERPQDEWAQQWGRAFVEFAAGDLRGWLRRHRVSLTPVVGWAERGGSTAHGHGNSVPRFHVPWGTGTGVALPIVRLVRDAVATGRVRLAFRHRVDGLITEGGVVTGITGTVLEDDPGPRGAASSRTPVRDFTLRAPAVIVCSGGIGGAHDLVRAHWPERLGSAPRSMITGVPAYVDGRMLSIAATAGARLVNEDRMWHYTEGIRNWDPIWPTHGIRILPGPSPIWLDALGRRLPAPALPGFDTLETLRRLRTTPDLAAHDHSWFIMTKRMLAKEVALSGSEQNPDITNRDYRLMARTRLGGLVPGPVADFVRHGADFVTADSADSLVRRMNAITGDDLLDVATVQRQLQARDLQLRNDFTKDAQIMAVRNARASRADRMTRVTPLHRMLDPKEGPLVGIRLHTLTRKSLGGLQTDLSGRVRAQNGEVVAGLYAAGEAAGFGGGGVHGYRALEGTFLGGCIFSGMRAGQGAAA
ncbi:MAG: FAD-binding dehydrogenase [Actinobacteria bacterium]|nr:FAD-binding dehydrogenase [Actinomycetota bacterium]